MVTRSTLDPIEEARARVRLRYQRARKVHPGMPQIGLAAERLGRKVGAKKLPAVQVLQRRWREIVGEKLYPFCRRPIRTGGQSLDFRRFNDVPLTDIEVARLVFRAGPFEIHALQRPTHQSRNHRIAPCATI